MKPGTDCIGVGVGAFILNDSGEVLLMRRGPKAKNEVGAWALPGGSVEFNETLRDAVIRETREELGIELDIDGQLPSFDHIIPDEGQHWVTNIFTARIASGEPKIAESEKCNEIGWFALDALPSPIARMAQGAFDTFLNI
jgi:8-oxo-dGTP diphosphatase